LFDGTVLKKGLVNSGSGLEVPFVVDFGNGFEDLIFGMIMLRVFFWESLD
jgi:hypothetical protein